MKGARYLMLLEHLVTKVEGGQPIKYGEPRSVLPVEVVARRLGISLARLVVAMRREQE